MPQLTYDEMVAEIVKLRTAREDDRQQIEKLQAERKDNENRINDLKKEVGKFKEGTKATDQDRLNGRISRRSLPRRSLPRRSAMAR